MGAAAMLLLLLLLLGSVNVASAVWRYSNNMESRIAINTRRSLRLDYEGNSLIQWIVPKPCTVSSLTSPSVTLNCPVRGMYRIYPRVYNQTIEDAPRTFNLGAALFNYVWYMVKMPDSLVADYVEEEHEHFQNPFQKDIFRIWILDPEKASSAELNNKAEVPSLLSRVLTKEFFNLGQSLDLESYPINHEYTTQFHAVEGYWTVIIYNLTTEVIVTLYGKPITFQDLFIMDTSYTIEKRLDLSVIKALGYLSLKLAHGTNPLIIHHPCSATSALLLTDFGTFISHDGFVTVEELKIVPTEIQQEEQNEVKTAAFLGRNILFLIGDSLYIRHAKGFYAQLGSENNLPDDDIIGLRSRTSCAAAYPLHIRALLRQPGLEIQGGDHKLNILIKMVNNLMLFGMVGTDALLKLHRIILYHKKDYSYSENYFEDLSVLQEPSEKHLEFIYNLNKYGCPIRVYYKSAFKPPLDLYYGLQYYGAVQANFIMWEANGRTDFYYNTTMAQAGCVREAQTWNKMLKAYDGDMKYRDQAWGPENYRSCFDSPGLFRNMHRPYEILNASSNIFITWPTDYTGIYLFTVKVVDPNYSFCKLTAHFAVETYGVFLRKNNTVVLSVVWSFIFVLLCSFGYSYYKYMNIFGEMLYFNKSR
ncbi:cation channel sperm-associated auxiliary subunit epsilon-like [Rhinoraja longicauda]